MFKYVSFDKVIMKDVEELVDGSCYSSFSNMLLIHAETIRVDTE